MRLLLPKGGEACRRAEQAFLSRLAADGMAPHLAGGVLLALSGGADSRLLLALLSAYCHAHSIPLAVAHIHHGLRGEAADRDADFCRTVAEGEGIPFFLVCVDTPAYLRGEGRGMGEEAAARHLRYAALEDLLSVHPEYAVCATAHTATDNLETVLFHLMRGSGLRGLCGIPPVRLPYLRPLLSLGRADIEAALDELGLSYVTDATNADTAYDRNYIRAEILPRLARLSPSPEQAITRLTSNLREEEEALAGEVDAFFDIHVSGNGADREALAALPRALRARVYLRMYEQAGGRAMPARCHITALHSLLEGGRVSCSCEFPDAKQAHLDRYTLSFRESRREHCDYEITLCEGRNPLPYGGEIWLVRSPEPSFEKDLTNIYNLSIQAKVPSVKMVGKPSARSRLTGDAYRTGNMTRRVRRLLSSLHLGDEVRDAWPVITDGNGILWVPGFGLRDGARAEQNDPNSFALYYVTKGEVPYEQ